MKIGINPGHDTGGHVGAVNPAKSVDEGHIVLQIGILLQEILKQQGHDIVFIQQDNMQGEAPYYNYKDSVVGFLNEQHTELNISLHCNAWDGADEDAEGTETFYYSTNEKGLAIAANIQTELVRLGFANRGIKHGNHLAFCRETTATSVLVEIGFIRNSHDLNLLLGKQKDIAEGIAKAIRDYGGKL